jgi:hypothetical protein
MAYSLTNGFAANMTSAQAVSGTQRAVGSGSFVTRATATVISSKAASKVSAPVSQSTGAQLCLECHANIAGTVANTRHAQAGVQCESCHGPAASHAANPDDPLARPSTDLTGAMCGKCHTGSRHPIYEEWKTSDHAEAVAADRTSSSCGRCHSEAVRLSLLKNEPVQGNTSIGIACVTCHDPHVSYVWTDVLSGIRYSSQLRNPLSSTNDYFMSPLDVFAKKYNAQINICAQCHNHRGAAWTVSSAPPHRSLQYNMLLGTVGELDSGLPHYRPAAHALTITNQCVGCHMQTAAYQSEAQPAVTGHNFKVQSYDLCLQCHPFPQLLQDFTKIVVTNQIGDVKLALDLWAVTKAPLPLRTKYGTRAWEYTTPGELSPGGAGPKAAEQTQIPVNIRKARFNLYLVQNDGSFGVHNGPFTITLLETAEDWILEELYK